MHEPHSPVALVTSDFRLYHELVPYFEEAGVSIKVFSPNEALPDYVQVVLNGEGELGIPVTNMETTLVATLLALSGNGPVVVGLDPGLVVGMALLKGGRVVRVMEAHSIDEARQVLDQWQQATELCVHIGDGDPPIGNPLFEAVRAIIPDTHFVKEFHTSPPKPVTKSRHTDAACYIAMRTPYESK